MSKLIDKYVYDVVRRLPEQEREDVSNELNANIYDMLSDPGDEKEVEAILTGLGAPSLLAEKYRQNPRYLISPAVYGDYIRVLKWIIPFIGILVMVIAMVFSVISSISGGTTDVVDFTKALMKDGISAGLSAVVQTLLWTTIGFAIADRSGSYKSMKAWKLSDLDDVIIEDRKRIPLADTIVELAAIIVFAVGGILVCSNRLPIPFFITDGDTQIQQFFHPDFLQICIPVMVVIAVLGITSGIVKIAVRHWTIPVGVVSIICSLVGAGTVIYILLTRAILSPELAAYVEAQEWIKFMGEPALYLLPVILSVIIAVTTLIEVGMTIYRVYKAKR